MAPPPAVPKALDGRDERPPVSALKRRFRCYMLYIVLIVVVIREGLSVRCHWSGLGLRCDTDEPATGELTRRRCSRSVDVAIRRSSIRVDSRRFFVEKCITVRMLEAVLGPSLGPGLVTDTKWERNPIFWRSLIELLEIYSLISKRSCITYNFVWRLVSISPGVQFKIAKK